MPTRLNVHARDFPGLLSALDAQVPDLSRRLADDRGTLRPHLLLFVNEKAVAAAALEGLALAGGDRVLFLASVSGG